MNPTVEIDQLQSEFRAARAQNKLTAALATQLSARAAILTIAHHEQGHGQLRPAVQLLCEIASQSEPEIARAGTIGLFPELIERLNDSFAPSACALYDQVFAQVIDFHRRLPAAREFDESLKRFGLFNETDLLTRKSQILKSQIPNPTSFNSVKRVLLPSRVTIGADVAVTSVLINKLRPLLPQAEFVLLGSPKLRELFGGDQRIRVREIKYERGGTVLARLTSWLDVVATVDEERRDLSNEGLWLLDPDSRLTQLGLLPLLTDERNYFFFESRSYRPNSAAPLGQLASQWLAELIGDQVTTFPFIALTNQLRQFGQTIVAKLRRASAIHKHLITISFGVGGNERKRVSAEFEEQLVHHLLTDARLILDKGASETERAVINRIVTQLRAQGRTVVEVNQQNAAEMCAHEALNADVVTWDGGIGHFAALIAASDEYIGYDSSGQHITAALGVPVLTIFVNSNSTTFAERWRPYGVGVSKVVCCEAAELLGRTGAASAILSQTLQIHRQLRASWR
jgi:ADP-heptose:LPS heptosyltransferase